MIRLLVAAAAAGALAVSGCGGSATSGADNPTTISEPKPQTMDALRTCFQENGTEAVDDYPHLLVSGEGPNDKLVVTTEVTREQVEKGAAFWLARYPQAGTESIARGKAADWLLAGFDLAEASELVDNRLVVTQLLIEKPELRTPQGIAVLVPLFGTDVVLRAADNMLRSTSAGTSNIEQVVDVTGLSPAAIQAVADVDNRATLKQLAGRSDEGVVDRMQDVQAGPFLVLYRRPDGEGLSATLDKQLGACLPGWRNVTEAQAATGSSSGSSSPDQASSGGLICDEGPVNERLASVPENTMSVVGKVILRSPALICGDAAVVIAEYAGRPPGAEFGLYGENWSCSPVGDDTSMDMICRATDGSTISFTKSLPIDYE